MSTPNTIKAQLQSLIDTSNATTGKEDTDLTSAVGSLVEGYGQGGGSDNYYNDFWDTYQQNGERTEYSSAFGDGNFNKKTFKPKYDMKITGAQKMFSYFPNECDLREILEECGVVLDFSNAAGNYVFNNSHFTALPIIKRSNTTGIYNWFSNCTKLHTIEKIVVNKNIVSPNLNGFAGCSALQNVIFEGEIASNIDFRHSPLLSDASVQNIIDCLVDLTGKDTQTIKFHADIVAKIDANPAQLLAITDKNWTLA